MELNIEKLGLNGLDEKRPLVIAGPCSAESEEQVINTAIALAGKADAGGGSNPTNISCDGHRLELDNMADAIRNGTPLMIDGREGRRAVELICGIYESIRSGKKYIFK